MDGAGLASREVLGRRELRGAALAPLADQSTGGEQAGDAGAQTDDAGSQADQGRDNAQRSDDEGARRGP